MMESLPDDKDILEKFRKGVVDLLPEDEQKNLWQHIDCSVEELRSKRKFLLRVYPWVAAACIILLIGIGYWQYNYRKTATPDMQVVETLAQRKQVTLPDSTVVWINAGSRLEYPKSFADNRFVYLEGEACFKVTPDAAHPFVVHVSEMDITVLGTVFNISAYHDEDKTVTTLVEGKIALQMNRDQSQQTILTPNQQATFFKDTKKMTFATVDPQLYTSWVNGYYRFENASLEQIAKHFERAYDVTIVFDDPELKSLTFTGAFLQEQSLEAVLALLRSTMDFHYTINANQVNLSQ